MAAAGAPLLPASTARAQYPQWPDWLGTYSGAVRFHRSIPLEDIFPPPKNPCIDLDDRAPFGVQFTVSATDDVATIWLRIDGGPMQTSSNGETLRFGALIDGTFWRRHFTALFSPGGADMIVWVFDAAGTRARTWRGSAIRRS